MGVVSWSEEVNTVVVTFTVCESNRDTTFTWAVNWMGVTLRGPALDSLKAARGGVEKWVSMLLNAGEALA